MSTYSVTVSNLSPQTTEQALFDFFSFCGKITSIEKGDKSATIHFEKVSAAKTALMLNGGTLDSSHIEVTSEQVHEDPVASGSEDHSAPLGQEDKPRAGIAAEYLAKGYVLGDHILQRAIDIDAKQGISARFLAYIKGLDKTIGAKVIGTQNTPLSTHVSTQVHNAAETVRQEDAKRGISKQATDLFTQYYSKVIATPIGQKVAAFYTSTTKQVLDIHEEARRIADQQKAHGEPAIVDPVPAPVPETTTVEGTAL